MTDEIADECGEDAIMIEFYTKGPKTYAYRVKIPVIDENGEQSFPFKEKVKAKGITQIFEANNHCNFLVIKQQTACQATGRENIQTLVPLQQIRANKKHEVITREMLKIFQVTSEKRRIIGNETIPYGYIEQNSEYNDDRYVNYYMRSFR